MLAKKTKRSQSYRRIIVWQIQGRGRLLGSRNITNDNFDEEVAKLNLYIHWVAKPLGGNKGLQVLQFKVGMLGCDIRNTNSVLWKGENPHPFVSASHNGLSCHFLRFRVLISRRCFMY